MRVVDSFYAGHQCLLVGSDTGARAPRANISKVQYNQEDARQPGTHLGARKHVFSNAPRPNRHNTLLAGVDHRAQEAVAIISRTQYNQGLTRQPGTHPGAKNIVFS